MILLTVYFEEPFWVGVFERTNQEQLQTVRVVFGSEPKDYQVYEFIHGNFDNLNFGRSITIDKRAKTKINPKKLQKQINKQLQQKGISTKAQQAISLEREAHKIERKVISREEREQKARQLFEQQQLKKKDKKRGH